MNHKTATSTLVEEHSAIPRQISIRDFFPKETNGNSDIRPVNKKLKNSRPLLRGFLLVRCARKLELDIKDNLIMKYVNFHMDYHDSPRSY